MEAAGEEALTDLHLDIHHHTQVVLVGYFVEDNSLLVAVVVDSNGPHRNYLVRQSYSLHDELQTAAVLTSHHLKKKTHNMLMRIQLTLSSSCSLSSFLCLQ
jgi:hypothetical protein